jgi:hypothetical protein
VAAAGLSPPFALLADEARALLTRLDRVKPFAVDTPMVDAAGVSLAARYAIDVALSPARRELRERVLAFVRWVTESDGTVSPADAQARFTTMRLRFNAVLTQFDIFADVLTQRAQHGFGLWLAGLDVLAADALQLRGDYYAPPPVICYMDRGHGAAIRRARTRLPGGEDNPVAIIRVPRERMVGTGVASSLVHEVGHQGSELLDLLPGLRDLLRAQQRGSDAERAPWILFERWISEIMADCWSVARVGITSTLGLMGVMSLPRAFVFRIGLDDPHPFPWIRVLLSCQIGAAFYPDPQWARLAGVWRTFYPPTDLPEQKRDLLAALESRLPTFVDLLVQHRPKALRGATLSEALGVGDRQPAALRHLATTWAHNPELMHRAPPSEVFAVLGQARADARLTPRQESRIAAGLLSRWAQQSNAEETRRAAERAGAAPGN